MYKSLVYAVFIVNITKNKTKKKEESNVYSNK